MKSDWIARLIGMAVLAIGGVSWGIVISRTGTFPFQLQLQPAVYPAVLGVLGALLGLIITPFLTVRPIQKLRTIVSKLSMHSLILALVGLLAGLIIAALLSYPLSLLPKPLGNILPFVGVLLCGYLGVAIFLARQNELTSFWGTLSSRKSGTKDMADVKGKSESVVLLDTSVIIDGRIADIARTGFIPGAMLIPRFVLNELQYIADSSDSLRRQRGRRGIEVLANLQKVTNAQVKISDIDVEGIKETDEKLIVLARQLRCPIVTNDYNLNRVAELQGVSVLNINELANAVKSSMLPGEILNIRVIQEGKELNQGVGYIDDGTMVVVENGKDYIDQEINVTVTKVLQTAAGRMIFARPE